MEPVASEVTLNALPAITWLPSINQFCTQTTKHPISTGSQRLNVGNTELLLGLKWPAQALALLPPLPASTSASCPPPTTQSTLVDVVVEGMGGGNEPGEGWQVPPELVFFLRSLGERLDPFSPTDTRASATSAPAGPTKSLTAALNHATLRPTTDQPAIVALFTELVVTERAYLKRIAALNQSYAIPLKTFSKSSQTKIIDKYEATSMFGKIDGVVSANTSLLDTLETCLQIIEHHSGSAQWADILSNHLPNIYRPYRDYLGAYDSIKETEQKLLKKSEGFRQFCERTKEAMYDEGMGRVGLRELLMEPVQRITRYILIFEQMFKKMSSNDPARSGLLACIATCNQIAVCELDDHLIKAATMWGLHRSIDHFPAILVKPGRYFIDSIDVLDIIPDTPSPTVLHCTLFLFNDTIVIAKKPANGQLTGRTLAGLDDMDRLVAAMKKSKTNTSSLNSVVSGGTDFFSKSLGGHSSTPTKLKKGSMRFKGYVDVHDVIVVNEPGQVGIGPATEVGFDLYLQRPPQDVSPRWSDRPFRHYVVCPPPTPALSGHEKSLSLSAHPSSSASSSNQPPFPTSHSLSHKSHPNLGSQQAYAAALAERDRFLDNLRKSQALVKAADDRSTVMRTKFIHDNDHKAVIDSFWNLYDKETYLYEQRKHRVVLQLVGTDAVDPLQFVTESTDPAPPLMIIRAHFNDPDDPDCRVHVRRKPNYVFPSLNASIDKAEEDIVVQTEFLSGLIVRIIQAYGIADIPRGHIPSATSMSQQHSQQPYNPPANPPSPSRGFRTKSATILPENGVNSALPHRLFGTKEGLSRTKSLRSGHSKSISNGATASTPGTPSAALREIQPTATRSPGGPVWYRNSHKGGGIARGEGGFTSRLQEQAEPNPALLYDDLPRLRKEGAPRSPSPARSTLKGKGRAGSVVEGEEEEEEDPRWAGAESESQCSSVSGLSSYDDDDLEEQALTRPLDPGSRPRTLVGPRQLVPPPDRHISAVTMLTRAKSEPPGKDPKIATLGPRRLPETGAGLLGDSDRFAREGGSRNPSGSSLGKRSRSVDLHPHEDSVDADYHQDLPGPKKVHKTRPLVVRKPPPPSAATATAPAPTVATASAANGKLSSNRQHDPLEEDEEDTLSCVENNAEVGPSAASTAAPTLEGGGSEEDLGTKELFHEVKGKMRAMKSQIKKLKLELGKIGSGSAPAAPEPHPSSSSMGPSISTGGAENGGRSVNGSIPRSPRKLHLSEVARSTDASSALLKPSHPHLHRKPSAASASSTMTTSPAGPALAIVHDLDRTLDSLERKVRLVQNVEKEHTGALRTRHATALDQMKKERDRASNILALQTKRDEAGQEILVRLEKENAHLYDAFNEELDKMFADIQLPDSQAVPLIIQDLKAVAAERSALSTALGAAQRSLQLEAAKAECLENLLRQAGLL
ncbi:hypothetical protein PtB15_5B781 [Puccinia triticina]|nr:hypothetical protein PtB15_5B781 [Puccinia triticina]